MANAAGGRVALPVAGVLGVILQAFLGNHLVGLQMVIIFIPSVIVMFYVRYKVIRWLHSSKNLREN